MALPFKKGGGGFLHNVTGKLTALVFDRLDGTFDKGDRAGESWSKLSAKVTILQDGAAEPVETFVDCGFIDSDYTISEDGTLLEFEGDCPIAGYSEFGRLVGAMVEKGLPEDAVDEAGKNFQGIVGPRYTFIKVVDEWAQKKGRKQKNKKTGAEYTPMLLSVSAVFPEDAKAAPAAKGAAAKKTTAAKAPAEKKGTAAKATAAAAAAPAATAAPAAGGPDDDACDIALMTLLNRQPNKTIERSKVSNQIVRAALAAGTADGIEGVTAETRDAFRKRLIDADYLNGAVSRGVITFDADNKAEPITLA